MLAYTVLRGGTYQIDLLKGSANLEGRLTAGPPAVTSVTLPPLLRADGLLTELLDDTRAGLPDPDSLHVRSYAPKLSLEAIGPPYISSGGGPLGTFVRGGGSLLFGDMLAERRFAAAVQIGNHLRDLAIETLFLNRESRWNWGAVADLEPSIYRINRKRLTEDGGERVLTSEADYFQRTQFRVAGLLAYPFNQAQRLEFTAGVRHAEYQRDVRSTVSSLSTGRRLSQAQEQRSGGAPTTVGEVSAALIGDTTVWGPTAPILGSRYRLEIAPAAGELSYARLLLDYRRYLMPVRPYTAAVRLLHSARYGADSNDPRLLPTFLGSRSYVRGYGWNSSRCEWNDAGACTTLEELLASRILVGNVELRVPVWGIVSREIKYTPVPLDAFVFADGGIAWTKREALASRNINRRAIDWLAPGSVSTGSAGPSN